MMQGKRHMEPKAVAVKAGLWAVIFLLEALLARWESAPVATLDFGEHFVHKFLLPTLPFMLLFAVHDLLLAPVLIRRKRLIPYILCTVVALGFFSFAVLNSEKSPERRPEPMNLPGQMPPPPQRGFMEEPRHPDPGREPAKGEASKILIALMMLGVNLGAEYYRNYSLEKKRLEDLERENLRYRLEYLRYQINPHFFMNTLNNIHALVDDSPEKAKESIVELSRLMRHVLYENSGPTVALAKELDFLRHYLYLMRLRYTDNVLIEYSFPEDDGGIQVPPLLMATIAENAFKHGVSYKSESYIRLSVVLDSGKLIFRCANSLKTEADGRQDGGIGLDNIRKRLSLLYGENFVLHIDKSSSEYELLMVLPSKPLPLC